VKTLSLIDDLDFRNACQTILRSMPRNTRTRETFHAKLLETMPLVEISKRTASVWMGKLGWSCGSLKKTVYKDGHENPSVVAARLDFIDKMFLYDQRMVQYSGANMDVCTPPVLSTGMCEIIWLVHDESCFDSACGRHKVWTEDGHPPMYPKRGTMLHVSAIISEADGVESTRTIEPGKNKDGYWRNRDLVLQLEEDLPKIKAKYPNKIPLLQFDNSGNHGVFAPDALIQRRLKLSDGYPKLNEGDREAGLTVTGFRDTEWVDSKGIFITFYYIFYHILFHYIFILL